MAIISYNNLSSIGLIKDVNPKSLPANDKDGFAWTNVQGMRFKDGVITKLPGYELLIDTTSTIIPYFETRITNGSNSFYVYAGYNKIYCYFTGTHYNITRQSGGTDVNYAATANFPWNVALLNGFPIFNNGVDIPQAWTTVNQSTKLSNLAAWPTSNTAAVIRAYKAYLIALDVTDAIPKRYSNKVKWSGSALPGALPTTWDYTDPTNDAGEIELNDSEGYLVDCLPLNDYNILYKNTSTYIMAFVGGNQIFAFRKLFPSVGMLAKNCAVAFENKHFVVTNDDVIVHDGNSFQSVIDTRNRKYLFSNMVPGNVSRTFCVPNYDQSEIWICYCSASTTYPDSALIYNYRSNTWTRRNLPETPWISEGFIDISQSTTWASMGTSGSQTVNVGGNKTGATATGLLNDATVYTASIAVDGTAIPISITGSTAQTYTTLLSGINTNLGTAATASLSGGNILVTSNTVTPNSTVAITDTNLFSTLTGYVAILTAVAPTGTTWADATDPWNKTKYSINAYTLSMVVPSANNIFLLDKSYTLNDNGIPTYNYIERENLFAEDEQTIKIVKGVWPNARKLNGVNNTIDVWVGSSMNITGTTVWNGPYPFDTTLDNKIDCFVTGRIISIRFSSHTDIAWVLSSFDLDVIPKGKW